MKTWQAIILTIGISLIAIVLKLPAIIMYLIILGTAVWAAVDSSKIELKKYKTGISYPPFILFIAIALLWIIGFPWYLSVRYKIKHGLIPLKDSVPLAPTIPQPPSV